MSKFTDTIKIKIKAGDGGAGSVSFHREKYVPKGGPDGGDGGKGGDVYFVADRRYYNLSHFFKDKLYHAGRGLQGMGRNRHGADGEDLVIPVPPGTQITDTDTGELIADLIEEDVKFLAARGGIGGKGNAFFKSSTHQAPRMAQSGMPGEEYEVSLNLKLIADIGLVGLPNAGKSTLLSVLTNAKPKIGDYPFTTLTPNLGMFSCESGVYSIADIPGIIEGAHQGHGLGLSFLQHIERVRVILFLIDITGEDPVYTHHLLKEELKSYNPALLERPSFILLTKTDLADDKEISEKGELFPDEKVLTISSTEGTNIDELICIVDEIMDNENVKKNLPEEC